MLSADRFFPFLCALCLGVILCILPQQGRALSLAEVIAGAQSAYEKTDDLKANFLQEVTVKSLKKTTQEEGGFYFKKPHRMVWDYRKPKAKKFVINPQTAWLYIPEDGVVYIQKAEEVLKAKALVRFISGWGKLTEDFTITFARSDNGDKEGDFLLKLTPKERDFGVDEFFLSLDKDTFQITRLSFTDSYGNATRLTFRNIKINNNLTDKFFSFTPPPGVEIMKNR